MMLVLFLKLIKKQNNHFIIYEKTIMDEMDFSKKYPSVKKAEGYFSKR